MLAYMYSSSGSGWISAYSRNYLHGIKMSSVTTSYSNTISFCYEGGYTKCYVKKSSNGKTFYWYNNSDDFNTTSVYYIFIGFIA